MASREICTSCSSELVLPLRQSHFDYADVAVHNAALVPLAVVNARARRSARTNSLVIHLRDDVWAQLAIVDVTVETRKAAGGL